MKTRWALFSAAILIGFLASQVTSEEAVLGQGNISCGSWIENRRDDNPLAATRTAWVLGFITAFNQNTVLSLSVTCLEEKTLKY